MDANKTMLNTTTAITEIAGRIHELREISGISIKQMAQYTDISEAEYQQYENGEIDLPFSFLHKCALTFGVDLTELLEGHTAKLTSYNLTRKGGGAVTAHEPGIMIKSLAPMFRNKLVEPYWVTYAYSEAQQHRPIHVTTHSGQEFDFVLKGKLKVQIGDNTEILNEGDCILYDSGTPHGMIAVDGADCTFCAVVISGEKTASETIVETIRSGQRAGGDWIYQKFVDTVEDENGAPLSVSFKNTEHFNFAFDVVDALAEKCPNKLAMLHIDRLGTERRFTFADISRQSSRAANYFKSLGISKGDRVMLVLKRNYQFWPCIVGLHKLGAIAIPATNQLLEHDFTYRFEKAHVNAIICTADGEVADQVDLAAAKYDGLSNKILVGGKRPGWHDFDEEYSMFRSSYARTADAPGGDDLMLMYFSSGTSGYPKIAAHSYLYALGHFITAKYWQCVDPDGLHFTISGTGWGKAVWGKLYGQWLCEAAVFTYDFDRFNAADILPMFAKYNITSFCAPPTMYRFLIKEDLSQYDLSSIKHACIAGEALNPEVFYQFKKATGLSMMEGFGQTETTLSIANLVGMVPKPGSMGKPVPIYDVDLVDPDGNPTKPGETGEIVIRTDKGHPCGLFQGYYLDEEKTHAAWHDGLYHTGDTAWRDEDGYFWYVGRVDDLIKSSGYRIGPFDKIRHRFSYGPELQIP